MSDERAINTRYATDALHCEYAHVGLYDVRERRLWIARKRWGSTPLNVAHARMLTGGSNTASTADKDRFLCYWFHTPDSGEGLLHGYPIEWEEGHLMVRLDPNWDHRQQQLIRSTDTSRMERNLDQQFQWGEAIFQKYLALEPWYPLSWHMIGPRPADSMFYVQRVEPNTG